MGAAGDGAGEVVLKTQEMLDYMQGKINHGRWYLHCVRQSDKSYRFWICHHPFEHTVLPSVVHAAIKRDLLPGLQVEMSRGHLWFDYYLPEAEAEA